MPADIAAKLRVTAAALGCHSRKDLAARFRASNPRTVCEVESLHKWMQGRSTPRSMSLYNDWAAVLGIKRSGDWLAQSAMAAFIEEVAAATGASGDNLSRAAATSRQRREIPSSEAVPDKTASTHHGLAGTFACYVRSMVPSLQGVACRGTLVLDDQIAGTIRAEYREQLDAGAMSMTGTAMLGPWLLNVVLTDGASGIAMMLIFNLPPQRTDVLCGLMTSAVILAGEALPSATAILAVRVPGSAARMAGTIRYFAPAPGAITADLASAGAVPANAEAFDHRAIELLGPPPMQISQSVQAAMMDDFAPRSGNSHLPASQAVILWSAS